VLIDDAIIPTTKNVHILNPESHAYAPYVQESDHFTAEMVAISRPSALYIASWAALALPLELLRNWLTHGCAVRYARSGRRYPCPLCEGLCECACIGEGGTQRALLFWDEIQPPLNLRKLELRWLSDGP